MHLVLFMLAHWHGLLAHLNGAELSLRSLVLPVLFQLQVKMPTLRKAYVTVLMSLFKEALKNILTS